MKQVRFEESEVPYQTLARFGLTQEKIEDLPLWALEDIGQGRRSPLLPIQVNNDEGETLKSRTRFALVRMEDGKVDVVFYPQLEKRLKPHIRCLFPTRMRILAAAAAVILLCLSVGTVYLYMQPTSLQTVSTMAETRNVILPDGSSVLLNRHSSLSYPKRFKSDNREVQLTGEAYFEVSKDQKHPFIVQTEHINVQVLGTHFNVDAYRNNPEVKTTLLTGSVAVSNKSNSVRMILKPNEIAIYNKVGNKLTRQVTKNAKDEISWRDGEFIFDNLPLGEIARELSNSFDTPIHIADTSLQSYRISARFRNGEDLETILSVLHHAGYFNYSQNNKQIVITTKPDLK